MNDTLKYICMTTLILSGAFILYTPLVGSASMVNGLVMGKVFWFHLAMLLFTGNVCLVKLIASEKRFRFTWPDAFFMLWGVSILLTYDWQLNPEPEKLLFGGQLVMLWYLLRWMLPSYPWLRTAFLIIIMGTGLVEAVWGMGQLHGVYMSNHSLFRLTGSFFNPGPYSGYLAVILPICLGWALRKGKEMGAYWGWGCFLAIIVVLPAGMSRSAWIAALMACVWVGWIERIGVNETKRVWQQYRRQAIGLTAVVSLVLLAGIIGIYYIKQDSANGRLLMWKVTARAIAQQPLTGTGLGGFPAAYAKAQADYFASGKATATERLVAGCPEYAFNEYLQIGLEQGVGGLLLFLLWLGSCVYAGLKSRSFGAVGGLLALSVFAFSSYPLQLPSFWVIGMFLAAICVSPAMPSTQNKEKGAYVMLFILLPIALSGYLYWMQQDTKQAYAKWSKCKMLYNNKAYSVAEEEYVALYPYLSHKPEFLFEGAQCISKSGNPAEANQWLQRAIQLSADPMFYYMMAKNEQAMALYPEAERHLLYAIDILPERLYPYFLLTKLYTDSGYWQIGRSQAAADSVLTKEPKIQTTAVREMREEVIIILNNIQSSSSLVIKDTLRTHRID